MKLTFDAAHLLKLLDYSEAATVRRPTMEQAYSNDFLRDDLPEERREAISLDMWSVKDTDRDLTKIPAGLMLVGDQGVYFLSNAPHETMMAAVAAGELENHVAYADQVNPRKLDFDTWYGAKRRSFGGDDGTEFFSPDRLRSILEACVELGQPFAMDLTPKSMRLYEPQRPETPEP